MAPERDRAASGTPLRYWPSDSAPATCSPARAPTALALPLDDDVDGAGGGAVDVEDGAVAALGGADDVARRPVRHRDRAAGRRDDVEPAGVLRIGAGLAVDRLPA